LILLSFQVLCQLKRVSEKLGSYLGINETATSGIIASFAHVIFMLVLMKHIDPRGKVISAAFVFHRHIGFVAGINPEMAFPMIVSNPLDEMNAIMVALFILKRQYRSA